LSLGAKERRFGADSGQKFEDLVQKYQAQTVPVVAQPVLAKFQRRPMMSKTASVRFYRSSKKRVSFQQGVVQFN